MTEGGQTTPVVAKSGVHGAAPGKMALPAQPGVQLDNPGSCRAGKPAEVAGCDFGGDTGEVCVIKHIEHVPSDLDFESLGQWQVLS